MPDAGPDGLFILLLVGVLIAINGLAVFNEFALVAMTPTRVRALEEDGGRIARMVARSVHRLDDYIAADQLAITITSIAVGWIGQPGISAMLQPLFESLGLPAEATAPLVAGVIAFSLITGTQMVFGELVPKSVALRFPEQVAMAIAIPIEIMAILLRPLTLLLNGTGRLILRPFGITAGMASHHGSSDVAELAESIQASAAAGLLLRPGTVRSAILFGELRAQDVMRPRSEVVALSAQWTVGEMMAAARQDPHVRYPVHRGDLDSAFGFLNITELAALSLADEDPPEAWLSAVRPIAAVYEGASLERVLSTFQSRRQQLCLVVDGSGGVEGVVTLSDVMAGMVEAPGTEAADEPEQGIVAHGGDTLHEIETRTGLRLDHGGSASTLNGIITDRLERFPQEGDQVDLEDVRLTVRTIEGRVAGEVTIEHLAEGT
ncbi:MAG: hemolysin family protein [Chloroflexota bacterium]|nr:hemolysin family protein [Chloroflexota bacterium]